jgi:hypothetical protein
VSKSEAFGRLVLSLVVERRVVLSIMLTGRNTHTRTPLNDAPYAVYVCYTNQRHILHTATLYGGGSVHLSASPLHQPLRLGSFQIGPSRYRAFGRLELRDPCLAQIFPPKPGPSAEPPRNKSCFPACSGRLQSASCKRYLTRSYGRTALVSRVQTPDPPCRQKSPRS